MVHSLGFSKEHDAHLLNKMALSGSHRGSFTYIDTLFDIESQITNAIFNVV